MRSVRTVVRTLIAGFLALAGPLLAAPAVLAHAQEVQHQSSRTDRASSHQVTVSIDAMNHSFATPNSTVTVSGTVTNHTGSALQGIQVQLQTTAQDFLTRSDMDSYAAGTNPSYPTYPVGTADVLSGTLRSGATAHWTASFSTSFVGYSVSQLGVYPLAAQAEYADGTPAASDRTFLPFWPGRVGAQSLNVSWVWPLIDQPQQSPCGHTLATNSLAASVATGGRLSALLSAGTRWAQQDHLTWAVDPALLSDVNTMTRPYLVGGDSLCDGRTPTAASAAATRWLAQLRTGTAGEPMFLTPYADVDVSALTHDGLGNDLHTAYQLGESVARNILSRPFGINGESTGDGGSLAVGWPSDGVADASVLTSLASNGGISTTVLSSGEMPSTASPYEDALGSAATPDGGSMPVVLADSGLTSVLGSATAGSSAGGQFAAEQDYLAQTAMIVAEAPSLKRSLVVAPPRRWDPSAAEAAKLLEMTSSAPWLHKVPLSALASAARQLKTHKSLPNTQVGHDELSSHYLAHVTSTAANLAVYEDLLYQPAKDLLSTLNEAAIVPESTAWRGRTTAGWLVTTNLADYLTFREQQVNIISGTRKLLLAGASGPAPVSVQNLGDLPVQVKVVAVPENSQLSVGNGSTLMTVFPKKTGTQRMTVHSAGIGTTTMRLQLVTKHGMPLTWTAQSLSVQATRYGRALLVLIGAALGVLVLASVARWVRRLSGGKPDGRSGGTG